MSAQNPEEPIVEPVTDPAQPTQTTPAADDTTVGTGTSIALGCIVGTILLILFGLVFIGLNALLN